MEVKRLQHRINFIIAHIVKEEPEATERQSTDDLQSLQDRIKSITLVVDALDRSCNAETAVGVLPTGSPEKPAKEGRTSPTASPEKLVKKKPTSPFACDAASRLRASWEHTDRDVAWRKNSGPQ